ncbi:hypothetical protein DYB25_011947 [Aphanomyces astaci]|uniref:Nitroreductase domain-containing protein n=2 Tax=Aphanomyces astaci TaxID=112090 RepID=A0A397C853_APHAT|nr:hypothetical protein DYB36_010488 [Aphanomyces astaci]RHY35558.1 hypothetical protein DYB38_013113 [Aphanomyces astaci]RHY37196.1 hypothetical protein DYB25_011947 [Aphanomyces astaci]RHY41143.1 hypothetical protein DYB30_006774 [Aphanomyces astaci]RHZ14668.1 hypothetical protein DYB26_005091 [Aphanomyces astaci]
MSSSSSSSSSFSIGAVVASAVAGASLGALASTYLRPAKTVRKDLIPFLSSQGKAVVTSKANASDHDHAHVDYHFERISHEDARERSKAFAEFLTMRRSLRFYSNEDVPLDIIENCIEAAGTAPSGAHTQPWYFCVVKTAALKEQIRQAVEIEEEVNYQRRMNKVWVGECNILVSALPDAYIKPYLTEAPYIIVVMKRSHDVEPDGTRKEVYYPEQSCGIASGLLITALHNANLATLTSTPMGAESKIRTILGRPANEKVYLLMPVGYPAADGTVPYRTDAELRKPMKDIYQLY